MSPKEFLQLMLPQEGYRVVVTFDGQKKRQTTLANTAQVIQFCRDASIAMKDVFYALSTFKQKKVWNPDKQNKHTGSKGMWETRTHDNSLHIKTLFLDVDVDANKETKHATRDAALASIKYFCRSVGMPKPLIVSSGGGFHVYWPFAAEMPTDEWKPIATKLQAAAGACDVRADPICADQSRILRVPGSFNNKGGQHRPTEIVLEGGVYDPDTLDGLLTRYIEQNNVPLVLPRARRVYSSAGLGAAPDFASEIEGNVGVSNNPLSLDMMEFGCPALHKIVAVRGAGATEPEWRWALGLAKFCEPQKEALLAVSDGHAGYDPVLMEEKVAGYNGAPSLCHTWWKDNPIRTAQCRECVNYQRVISPAQLGRVTRIAEAPTVTIDGEKIALPNPPWPYKRTEQGSIVITSQNADGRDVDVPISPYDMYPLRVLRQTGTGDQVDENSVWRMHLPPRFEAVDVQMPTSLISDVRRLHTFLMGKGLYIDADMAKKVQFYMTAYLRSLVSKAEKSKVYDRLGWHDDYKTFVLAHAIYHRDGSVVAHDASKSVQTAMREGVVTSGTLEGWVHGIKFYGGDKNYHNRAFLLGSFASPLLHMTGHKGVLMAASGETGRGKTTMLEACASVWGHPERLVVYGGPQGATVNAMYYMMGVSHSLPILWDETTERETQSMKEFLLAIPQGKGKIRLNKASEHDGKLATWEAIVMSSANTDDVSRILAVGKDSDPQLMRMVGVEFEQIDTSTEAKIKADKFKRAMREHYGHAGPIFIRYVTEHYLTVKRRVEQVMEEIDREMQASSPERYWTALVAVLKVAGEIASKLGLYEFDVAADVEWFKKHIVKTRVSYTEMRESPAEMLTSILNSNINQTLVISAKSASNIDNIATRPSFAIAVRYEVDVGVIYISRSWMVEQCDKLNANFRKLENSLIRDGVILHHSVQKVLGADTPYARGQLRCWKVDDTKLGVALQPHQIAAPSTGSNVVPMKKKAV